LNINWLDKSIATTLASILLIILGFISPLWPSYLLHTGLFAFSGAITNWLAVHMLFEKVPFLYGSGVIPNQFEEFRSAIRDLIMKQFFNPDNVNRFITAKLKQHSHKIDFKPFIDKLNYDKLFDKLLEAIQQSSLGGMLGLIGGLSVLNPLREPFSDKIKEALMELANSSKFQSAVSDSIFASDFKKEMYKDIEDIVTHRLQEMTPELVKEITQAMIKKHLGWLVVWGGVFGGLIGLIVSFFV